MKALCLVAHPDDCVIFALSYIHNHPELDWTIGYLTYTDSDPRGAEMAAFWQRRGISTVFLGFEDHWQDDEQKQFTRWHSEPAEAACWNLAKDYDVILTHDADGDYGHIHHQLVHRAVARHCHVVTFAPHNQGTVTLMVPPGTYTLDELPMHGDIIRSFHIDQHRNSYKEPQ
jgi:LmbE family N-acetylglucosaminyl deacetylase